jgi:hypothetical protein
VSNLCRDSFVHRSHWIHSDIKLAQVAINSPVVTQPQSTISAAADRGPIPVVHVKVTGFSPRARKTCLYVVVSKHLPQILETVGFLSATVWTAAKLEPAGALAICDYVFQ